eukprot:12077172-Alexandrium_andersonii.AAC.1
MVCVGLGRRLESECLSIVRSRDGDAQLCEVGRGQSGPLSHCQVVAPFLALLFSLFMFSLSTGT